LKHNDFREISKVTDTGCNVRCIISAIWFFFRIIR
jgi:hypothetical protein